ncbi:YdhK family protein [Tetragenococcus muriaticus]|uniref:DUF1541 domain-containing protein n=2 Tax=Tetragenococcus muriaticus TaxID=64642 RepID=A0A091C2P4_9ENTE|nr:YdhK family protein [Tetragenococcus muriaticus]KFN90955.1 hypothetical protein TMU3MR103_1231 [Tetragenococcus muriaticus 3MR10-3]KFN91463.1 hypothetical protein TMUPMC115_1384 [Tetragenococcus muriaticus PMC-11-5]GMA47121.1 hypothetical protein GCM10025854_13710 [Tetragenococcus muriaticus]
MKLKSLSFITLLSTVFLLGACSNNEDTTEGQNSSTASTEMSEMQDSSDHMEGMQGQNAEITGIHEGPAYMINFEPNDGSKEFVNHKWVTEDELSPVDQ